MLVTQRQQTRQIARYISALDFLHHAGSKKQACILPKKIPFLSVNTKEFFFTLKLTGINRGFAASYLT